MSWSGSERRQHPRVAFQAEAVVTVDEVEFGRFAVRDISVGGALVIGQSALSYAAGIAFRRPPSQIASMIEEVVLNELAALERASHVG
jgi:hypothetical protein